MNDNDLHVHATLQVAPSLREAGAFTVSWGEGSEREHFTASAELAALMVSTQSRTTRNEEVERFARGLGLPSTEAEQLVDSLVDYGLLRPTSREVTAAEERWIDVSWHDALSFHLATRDMKWLHDYGGSPQVMTKFHVDDAAIPTTPRPAPRRPEPQLSRVSLPAALELDRDFEATMAARRTSRRFRDSRIAIDQVATILDWTLRPRWEIGASRLFPAQTYSLGAPFTAFCLFDSEGAPDELPHKRGVYEYDPSDHSLAFRSGLPEQITRWRDVLWEQTYADGAAMILLLAVDWKQFWWKYRAPRAYRWAFVECGGFMQTALTVATALGLRTFQTPAIQDGLLADTVGVDDAEMGLLYLAAMGS